MGQVVWTFRSQLVCLVLGVVLGAWGPQMMEAMLLPRFPSSAPPAAPPPTQLTPQQQAELLYRMQRDAAGRGE